MICSTLAWFQGTRTQEEREKIEWIDRSTQHQPCSEHRERAKERETGSKVRRIVASGWNRSPPSWANKATRTANAISNLIFVVGLAIFSPTYTPPTPRQSLHHPLCCYPKWRCFLVLPVPPCRPPLTRPPPSPLPLAPASTLRLLRPLLCVRPSSVLSRSRTLRKSPR